LLPNRAGPATSNARRTANRTPTAAATEILHLVVHGDVGDGHTSVPAAFASPQPDRSGVDVDRPAPAPHRAADHDRRPMTEAPPVTRANCRRTAAPGAVPQHSDFGTLPIPYPSELGRPGQWPRSGRSGQPGTLHPARTRPPRPASPTCGTQRSAVRVPDLHHCGWSAERPHDRAPVVEDVFIARDVDSRPRCLVGRAGEGGTHLSISCPSQSQPWCPGTPELPRRAQPGGGASAMPPPSQVSSVGELVVGIAVHPGLAIADCGHRAGGASSGTGAHPDLRALLAGPVPDRLGPRGHVAGGAVEHNGDMGVTAPVESVIPALETLGVPCSYTQRDSRAVPSLARFGAIPGGSSGARRILILALMNGGMMA